jgi:hypothetical protein
MPSHAIQPHPTFTPPPAIATAGFAQVRPRRPRRPAIAGREPVPLGARQAQEPALSIEESIRRYVESQPPQLYRGGA